MVRCPNPIGLPQIALIQPRGYLLGFCDAGDSRHRRWAYFFSREKTSTELVPQNPEEFVTTASGRTLRGALRIRSNLQSGSGLKQLALGGNQPEFMARIAVTDARAAEAPMQCPVTAFVEEQATLSPKI